MFMLELKFVNFVMIKHLSLAKDFLNNTGQIRPRVVKSVNMRMESNKTYRLNRRKTFRFLRPTQVPIHGQW